MKIRQAKRMRIEAELKKELMGMYFKGLVPTPEIIGSIAFTLSLRHNRYRIARILDPDGYSNVSSGSAMMDYLANKD